MKKEAILRENLTLLPDLDSHPHATIEADPAHGRPGTATIELADVSSLYAQWPAPTVIVSDGAYGVGGFPGDPPTSAGLPEWYAAHAAAWARYSLPETTLWFWGTEVGWATVH